MFNQSIYIERRQQLKRLLKSGIVLIPGNHEPAINYPANTYKFRQDSTFLYFFGIDLPDLFGIIDLEGDDFIFGNNLTVDEIVWTGQAKSIEDHAESAGVSKVLPTSKIESALIEAQNSKRTIHFLPQYRDDNRIALSEWLNLKPRDLNQHASIELIKSIVSLRSIKHPVEIEELRIAAEIGYKMHVTAMQLATEGRSEREIAGIIEGISLSYGNGTSFPIILSQRGEILHNHQHNGLLQKGNLMVVDAGAESPLHYASDFTRTTPVNHQFSPIQKSIYEIVLQANNTARELSKPGVQYLDVHIEAAKVIANGLKQLGLMKGDVEEAVRVGAHALFFPHGLGHMLGLDVHDMEDYGQIFVGYDDEVRPVNQFGTGYLRLGRRLQPGFVITNEPGIYFIPELMDQWKSSQNHSNFINYNEVEKLKTFGGIRLEDDMHITATGAEIIGKRVPITIEEIMSINTLSI
jgi:Xaa-Pro aminopeptidase